MGSEMCIRDSAYAEKEIAHVLSLGLDISTTVACTITVGDSKSLGVRYDDVARGVFGKTSQFMDNVLEFLI